jgi:hypothetical protein
MYMAASRALKTTDPRATAALHLFRTGYSEMAMPALAKAAINSRSAPPLTWFEFVATLVR